MRDHTCRYCQQAFQPSRFHILTKSFVEAKTVSGAIDGTITVARLKPTLSIAKSAGTASRNGGLATQIIRASTGRAILSPWSATGKFSVNGTGDAACRTL